jgi:thioredoxin-related protein
VVILASALSVCARAEPPAAPADEPAAKPADDAKPKREPIYVEEANGKELIAAAVERARLERKHVIIEWGGNWCGWCYKLHDVFHNDELVRPIMAEEFELVLVDSRSNYELMQSYGGKDTRYAYPHLTILDARGEVLTNQETSSLEVGPKHDPEVVAAFLKKWQPEPVSAEDALAAALRQATDEDKRVLVHVGNPYCGWCKVLTRFLDAHKGVLSRDFVDLKLDTLRMAHGEEVAARFEPDGSQGAPWMVIVDASGKVLSTSVGAEGNIGYPVDPAEIEHFLSMLAGTKQRLGDAELQQIRADLDAYRVERQQRQAAREE